MPIRLKRLALRNWTTIRNAEIGFPEKGLVLVVGKTVEGGGKKESVGAGKTAVGEAISRALTGVSGRFENTGHFCHDEVNEDMYVRLEADCDGVPLTIEMGYKCRELSKTGEGLRFKYGDTEISRNKVTATRDELVKIIGVTPELADWTVFIDGQKLDFSSLSQRSSVELLMAALQQPPWSRYHEKSKRALANFKRDHDKAQAAHEEAQQSVVALTTSVQTAEREHAAALQLFQSQEVQFRDKLEAAVQAKQALQQQLADSELRTREIKAEVKAIEDQVAGAYKAVDQKRRELERKLSRAKKFKQLRQGKVRTLGEEKVKLSNAILRMKSEPANCPKCGKPWDAQHSKDEIQEHEQQLEKLTAKISFIRSLVEAAEGNERQYNEQLLAVNEEVRDQGAEQRLRNLSEECERLEKQDREVNKKLVSQETLIGQLRQGPNRSDVDRKKAVLDDRKHVLEEAKARVTNNAAIIAETAEAVKVMSYLNEAFSPVGIPNVVLANSIDPLNHVSRRISNILTDGTVQITYKTRRVLVSGDERPDLDIEVNNKTGSKRLKGSSKGETGQINLIVAETIAEVGNVASRIGYRWYDEVANSQDPVVRQCVFRYLKEVANDLGILVFLVDHHPEAANFADHFLLVSKVAEKTSTVEWVK